MTRRPYRLTPRPAPFLRVVRDDRVPLHPRVERELRARELGRKVLLVATLATVGATLFLAGTGAAALLRWWGR